VKLDERTHAHVETGLLATFGACALIGGVFLTAAPTAASLFENRRPF